MAMKKILTEILKLTWRVLTNERGQWEPFAAAAATSVIGSLLGRGGGSSSGSNKVSPAKRDTGQQTIYDIFMNMLLGSGNWQSAPSTAAMSMPSLPGAQDTAISKLAGTTEGAPDIIRKFISAYGRMPNSDELVRMGLKAPPSSQVYQPQERQNTR